MRVNWGALGIAIGLILVAISILAVGLVAGRSVSRLTGRLTTIEGLTADLTSLKKQIPIIEANIERGIIAQENAFSKAYSEKRAIAFEDLKDGYALADKFMGK